MDKALPVRIIYYATTQTKNKNRYQLIKFTMTTTRQPDTKMLQQQT